MQKQYRGHVADTSHKGGAQVRKIVVPAAMVGEDTLGGGAVHELHYFHVHTRRRLALCTTSTGA